MIFTPEYQYEPNQLYEWSETDGDWKFYGAYPNASTLRHFIADQHLRDPHGLHTTHDTIVTYTEPQLYLRTYYCGARIFRRVMTAVEVAQEQI